MPTFRPPRRILAAVADTSANGQVAARKAIELAWLFDADVVLYHACYDPALSGGVFFDTPGLAKARRELMDEAVARLESLSATLGEAGIEIHVQSEYQRNIPDAVARAAVRADADLIVAEPRYRATRRHRGLSHTDWELARLSPVPVLMCRSAAPYAKPRIVAAVDPGGHGLRPSSLDVRIVGLAAAFDRAANGRVFLVHCERDPRLRLLVRPELLRRENARVRGMLQRLAQGVGLGTRAIRIVHGEPASALLDAVNELGADLLVLGAVSRGKLGDLLIGSTAERLLHEAPCDILVVRPTA